MSFSRQVDLSVSVSCRCLLLCLPFTSLPLKKLRTEQMRGAGPRRKQQCLLLDLGATQSQRRARGSEKPLRCYDPADTAAGALENLFALCWCLPNTVLEPSVFTCCFFPADVFTGTAFCQEMPRGNLKSMQHLLSVFLLCDMFNEAF